MKRWTNAAFLTAALLLLMLGGGIGRGMGALERATMGPWRQISREVAWTWMAAQLSYAAAILGLSWLAFTWRPARWVGAVLGTVGLLILLYLPLRMSVGMPNLIKKATIWLYASILGGGFQAFTLVSAAVLAILGGWIAFGGRSKGQDDEDHQVLSE